jgi:hypothetical protein
LIAFTAAVMLPSILMAADAVSLFPATSCEIVGPSQLETRVQNTEAYPMNCRVKCEVRWGSSLRKTHICDVTVPPGQTRSCFWDHYTDNIRLRMAEVSCTPT